MCLIFGIYVCMFVCMYIRARAICASWCREVWFYLCGSAANFQNQVQLILFVHSWKRVAFGDHFHEYAADTPQIHFGAVLSGAKKQLG